MSQIRALKARKAEQAKSARSITEAAAAESRDLTAEEQQRFDAHIGSIRGIDAQIEREEQLANIEAGLDAKGAVARPGTGTIVVSENAEQDPKRGFASFGAFAQAVRSASNPHAQRDPRLAIGAAAPGVTAQEGSGPDGGFLVPPDFANEIWRLSLAEDSIVPLTDNTNLSGNSMVFPQDESTPWGTDGVRAYWQAEATAANPTRPRLGLATLRLHKLMALVPMSDELLEDQSALQSYVPGKVADSIRWKTNEAILFGTGAGQPLGAANSAATVTVPKDSGQASGTLTAMNLANMIARLPPGSYGRANWLMNNDALPALFTLTLGNTPIYIPASSDSGGFTRNPYGLLLGRPVLVSQHAPSFGSGADLQLLDLSYYRTITKSSGIETATSMHLYFDADVMAFRATYRIDGAPKMKQPIVPPKSQKTLSPFVQLQAR